jgi:hypothetical protein
MKIFRPGMPVVYVDEAKPEVAEAAEPNPLPSVEEAIQAANARQTQILEYTRAQQAVVDSNPEPATHAAPTQLDSIEAEIQRLTALKLATAALQPGPHSISDKPEVDK